MNMSVSVPHYYKIWEALTNCDFPMTHHVGLWLEMLGGMGVTSLIFSISRGDLQY